MKKLGKISINPEKMIKNEDLVNLRGGAYWCCTTVGRTPESELCSDSEELLYAFCYAWEGFGYDCECERPLYV